MKTIELGLRITTPMFLGGADSTHAELRVPSIRGALRFWARAVIGAQLGDDIEALKARETAIFGDTKNASPVVVRIRQPRGPLQKQAPGVRFEVPQYLADRQINGRAYLAYGVTQWQKRPRGESDFYTDREFLQKYETFLLTLMMRKPLSDQAREDLLNALWCWVHLGSLGTKGRNGYGSLECTGVWEDKREKRGFGLTAQPNYNTLKVLFEAMLRQLRGSCANPRFTRFSPSATITIVGEKGATTEADPRPFQDPNNVIAALGHLMIGYRRRLGLNAPAGEPKDYHWGHDPANHQAIPARAGFGLPLPFGKNGTVQGPGKRDRRASPLLMHVEPCGAGYYGVLTHLPAPLLPTGEKLQYKGGAPYEAYEGPMQQDVISDFLKWANKPTLHSRWTTSPEGSGWQSELDKIIAKTI